MRRRPYAWEGTLLVFFLLMLLLALNVFVGVLMFSRGSLIFSPILIAGELLVLATALGWASLRGLPWRQTFLLYPTSGRLLGLSLLLAVTWWPVAIGLATWIEQFFARIGPPPEIPTPQSPLDAAGFVLAIVILAPLCEEPVFRGFIMQGWLRYGFVAGVVGSGVLFGLQHAQLSGAIPLSLIGILLGIVAFRAGSLWPAITIHTTYNALAAPFVILPDLIPEISDHLFILAGLVTLPLALASLWLYLRQAPAPTSLEPEQLTGPHRSLLVIAALLVLGLFGMMAALEIIIRLQGGAVIGMQ